MEVLHPEVSPVRFVNPPLDVAIVLLPSSYEPSLPSAERSRDTSVRGQHGGHACGASKQIAPTVQLTQPRETSIPRVKTGRRCPNRPQDGRGEQTPVPVSARDQRGPFGEAACLSG